MQVTNMDRVLGDVVGKIVRRAVSLTGTNPAARGPNREAARMMVASPFGTVPGPLPGHTTTELATPHDQGLVEQSAPF